MTAKESEPSLCQLFGDSQLKILKQNVASNQREKLIKSFKFLENFNTNVPYRQLRIYVFFLWKCIIVEHFKTQFCHKIKTLSSLLIVALNPDNYDEIPAVEIVRQYTSFWSLHHVPKLFLGWMLKKLLGANIRESQWFWETPGPTRNAAIATTCLQSWELIIIYWLQTFYLVYLWVQFKIFYLFQKKKGFNLCGNVMFSSCNNISTISVSQQNHRLENCSIPVHRQTKATRSFIENLPWGLAMRYAIVVGFVCCSKYFYIIETTVFMQSVIKCQRKMSKGWRITGIIRRCRIKYCPPRPGLTVVTIDHRSRPNYYQRWHEFNRLIMTILVGINIK